MYLYVCRILEKHCTICVQKTTIAAGYYILTINMYVLEKLNMLRMSYGRINMVLCFCSASSICART